MPHIPRHAMPYSFGKTIAGTRYIQFGNALETSHSLSRSIRRPSEMKLTIIGTGYVGLVTGTGFAEEGHDVICVDNDTRKVKLLQSGGMPIYEPGLEELVHKNVAAGRLQFTASTAEGVEKSAVIFIAVPTPPQADGS